MNAFIKTSFFFIALIINILILSRINYAEDSFVSEFLFQNNKDNNTFEEKNKKYQHSKYNHFEIIAIIEKNTWKYIGKRTWRGQIFRFIVKEITIAGMWFQYEIKGIAPDTQKNVFIDRDNQNEFNQSLYVNVHGFEKKPDSLFFYQRTENELKFNKLKKIDFSIGNYFPDKVISSGGEETDQNGQAHKIIDIYFNNSYKDILSYNDKKENVLKKQSIAKKKDGIEKKAIKIDTLEEIYNKNKNQDVFQVTAGISENSWSRQPDNSWFGQVFRFKMDGILKNGEKVQYDIRGYYPGDKYAVEFDLGMPPPRLQSLYIYVHGFQNRPDALYFLQAPTNKPQFSLLSPKNFAIGNKNPELIIISDIEKKDYLGYTHPVIHLYYELKAEKSTIKTTKSLDTSTDIFSKTIIPHLDRWQKVEHMQSLIILDVTDDDRRAVAFKKGRNAVICFLDNIGWATKLNNKKYVKIASAFEGHLKYLKNLQEISTELPKVQAPSSLKEQLSVAFNSFDNSLNGPKKIIYIVSSKRADIITPADLEKLQINTNEILRNNISFNCIIIGDYGGHSMKNLTERIEGKFFRCTEQNDLVEKLKTIIYHSES